MRGIGRSDNVVGIELSASIWSLADSAGAEIRVGTLYDGENDVPSYHVALNASFNF